MLHIVEPINSQYNYKITQAKTESEISIEQSKVAGIIAGKRKPDMPFLKRAYSVLKIDADFLLGDA